MPARWYTQGVPATRSGALLLAGAIVASCAPPPPTGADGPAEQARAAADALAPDRLRIHPLTRITRITRETSGKTGAVETQLACHLELKDRFGHAVKALGRMRIELYRPTSSEPGGVGGGVVENQDLVWEVDLRDPEKNALLYDDLVTRTYALHLGGLPEWVVRWSAGESHEPWITIKATFTAVDCLGHERRLESTYRLQK